MDEFPNDKTIRVMFSMLHIARQGSYFTKVLKAIAVLQFFCHREWGKFKFKITAKKLGIAVDDIFRNSRPARHVHVVKSIFMYCLWVHS
jgi:hypothetical protein